MEIIKVKNDRLSAASLRHAAEIIRAGGLVAFPTETVYGLGASAFDRKAVGKIFKVKKRPFSDPLIVHVAGKNDIYRFGRNIPGYVRKLVKRFWPGPLTLVVRKKPVIPDIVTAGKNTVALRMPASAVARALIKASGVPIAAPSANRFSRPSATRGRHVIDDLGSGMDILIDGGFSRHGIESTVLDCSGPVPILLRAGAVPAQRIEKLLGISIMRHGSKKGGAFSASPGLMKKHYSPKAKLYIVDLSSASQVRAAKNFAKKLLSSGKKAGFLVTKQGRSKFSGFTCFVAGDRNRPAVIARNLFDIMRKFDSLGYDCIFAEAIKGGGIAEGIRERLAKAGKNLG